MTSTVYGGMQLNNGWWNTQLTGGIGLDITTIDRENDLLVTALAEYVLPTTSRTTLGLGIVPLWYDPYKRDQDAVWGAGAGIAGRSYSRDQVYRGWYVELHGYGIVHQNNFVANSSNFNFLIGGGLGYRFQNGWQAAVMFEHISNGGLGSDNQAINTLSPSIGYAFPSRPRP